MTEVLRKEVDKIVCAFMVSVISPVTWFETCLVFLCFCSSLFMRDDRNFAVACSASRDSPQTRYFENMTLSVVQVSVS